jgi:predicted RNA-binding protein YlxR (DUF448 family)
VVDKRKAMPGRGAWVHPDAACLDLAIKRKAITRALRDDGQARIDGLADALGAVVIKEHANVVTTNESGPKKWNPDEPPAMRLQH